MVQRDLATARSDTFVVLATSSEICEMISGLAPGTKQGNRQSLEAQDVAAKKRIAKRVSQSAGPL